MTNTPCKLTMFGRPAPFARSIVTNAIERCQCDDCLNHYLDRIERGDIRPGTYKVIRLSNGGRAGYFTRT